MVQLRLIVDYKIRNEGEKMTRCTGENCKNKNSCKRFYSRNAKESRIPSKTCITQEFDLYLKKEVKTK